MIIIPGIINYRYDNSLGCHICSAVMKLGGGGGGLVYIFNKITLLQTKIIRMVDIAYYLEHTKPFFNIHILSDLLKYAMTI